MRQRGRTLEENFLLFLCDGARSVEKRVSPLRCAPVEMTTFFEAVATDAQVSLEEDEEGEEKEPK